MIDPYEELDFNQAARLVRNRQRFTRRPKKSADIVSQLMARKGYGQLAANNELQQVWQRMVADQWRGQTRAGLIRNGVLEVMVANSVLNQRLEFEKKSLLAKLQQKLPQAKIRDIRFRIGNV